MKPKPLPEREELWMAYLDGEMTAAEAAAFVASLEPGERALSESETRLEAALASRLTAGPACPDATWEQTLALLHGHTAPRQWWRVERPLRAVAIFIVAVAAWAAAFGLNYDRIFAQANGSAANPMLALAANSLDEMLASAEVRGGQAEIQAFLDENRIPVALYTEGNDEHGHPRKAQLLGAGLERYGAVDVPVIYAACCGKPVKVVFLHACGRAKSGHCKDPDVVKSKRVGDFMAFIVTQHKHGAGILAMLDEKPLQTASAI